MLWYLTRFLYSIMLNLLKESCALHAIQLSVNGYLCWTVWSVWAHPSHTQFVDKMAHVICRTTRRLKCKLFIISVRPLHVAFFRIRGSYFSRCLFLKGIFKRLKPLWLLLTHCDYSWHGTRPYSWPVTPDNGDGSNERKTSFDCAMNWPTRFVPAVGCCWWWSRWR